MRGIKKEKMWADTEEGAVTASELELCVLMKW